MTKEFGIRTKRGFRRCLAAFAGLALVAACEGENLFTEEFSPQVQELSLPNVAYAGQSLNLRVDASAPRGISQIVLSLAGGVALDTVVTFTNAPVRIARVINVPLPAVIADTVILVRASIVDKAGDASRTREGTLVVYGPPSITSMSAPSLARLGELVSVRVTATGSRKITQLDLLITGAVQKDTVVLVTPARTSVSQDIILVLPSVVQDTVLRLAVSARDEAGQGSAPMSRTVPLLIDPPVVELVSPASARAGLNLDLQVIAQGARRFTDIRVELRGAVTKDVAVPLGGSQSNTVQNISVPLPGDIRVSDLRARAAVIDRGQTLAFSEEDLITIPIGPPVVTAVEAPLVAYRNRSLDVRVRASGDRPLVQVLVRARGAFDADFAYAVTPANLHDVTHDFKVPVPAGATDSTLILRVTATDISGSVSEIFDVSLSVTDPPQPDLASAVRPRVRVVPLRWEASLAALSRAPGALCFDPSNLAIDRREQYLRGHGSP